MLWQLQTWYSSINGTEFIILAQEKAFFLLSKGRDVSQLDRYLFNNLSSDFIFLALFVYKQFDVLIN